MKISKPVHHLIADKYFKKKNYTLAATFFKKALSNTIQAAAQVHFNYGISLYKTGDYEGAVSQLEIANLKTNFKRDEFLLRLSEAYIKLHKYSEAEKHIKAAISINGKRAVLHYILGVVLCLQKKWWQAEDALINAGKLGYSSAKYYRRLGQAAQGMKHYKLAHESYSKAANKWRDKNSESNVKAKLYYLAGLNIYLSSFDKATAEPLYSKALEYDSKLNSKIVGVGVFHENSGHLDLALEAYVESAKRTNVANKGDVLFRHANLLYIIGQYSEAKDIIDECLTVNYVNPKFHELAGDIYKELDMSDSALLHYRNALQRTSHTDIKLLNKSILLAAKTGDSSHSIQCSSILSAIYSSSEVDDRQRIVKTNISRFYSELFNSHPLNSTSIVYESFHGKNFSENPRALLEHLIEDGEFKAYSHIVVLNNFDSIPDHLLHKTNIFFIEKSSPAYAYYLATSKYLINNSTFPWWFIRKEGQQYLNTWHGTPWKTLGRDIKGTFLELSNTQRNFLQATHIISPNEHTTRVLTDRYDISDIYQGVVAETGYPRTDATLNAKPSDISQFKEYLNLKPNRRTVLYAPTWREIGLSSEEQIEQVKKCIDTLSNAGFNVIYRGHYFTDDSESGIDILKYTAPNEISTNELLAVADILVTDYSSVAFDFIATGKPIVFYLYDYEQYKKSRGLYFEFTELPGDKALNLAELKNKISELNNNKSMKPNREYINSIEKFCKFEDGGASKRVVDFFFKNDKSHIVPIGNDKTNILIYVGAFTPNGITSSGLNLLNLIDESKYNIHLLVNPQSIASDTDRLGQFSKLPKHIKVIAKTNGMNMTNKEQTFYKIHQNINNQKTQNSILQKIFEREYRRIFSFSKFDHVVNFEGYSSYYSALLLESQPASTSIYLHNDMLSESTNRFPQLEEVFQLYHRYDSVISVSKYTSKLNKGNLAKKYDIPVDRFKYIENVQNPDYVINSSGRTLKPEHIKIFNNKKTTFINIGRLSQEKDQEKLISAFSKVNRRHPNTQLVIVGDGPLRHRLTSLVSDLGLSNCVHLLGLQDNPYPYLKKSNCFVLSSNYEGQPVVLYEALTLNKPIIATDIVANRAVLEGGYGELCENSISGLEKSMTDFIDDKLKFKKFNINKYNENAISLFYKNALSK